MGKTYPNFKSPFFNQISILLFLLVIYTLTVNPTAIAEGGATTAKVKNFLQKYEQTIKPPPDKEAASNAVPAVFAGPTQVFSNSNSISIPDDGVTGVTSTISVSGTSGPISSITVKINNATLYRPQHIDMLLQGPGGQKFVFLSDAGGQNSASQTNNVTITFSDAGGSQFSQSGALTSGTFKPVDYDVSPNFPTISAPYSHAAPFGSSTFNSGSSVFGGLSGANVNGIWTLHIWDGAAGNGTGNGNSTIAGGWSLDIVTTPAAAPTTTVLSSSVNPSQTNQAITLTSTTTSTSTVSTGNVNFVDNTTGATLCGNVPVNGSGVATCNVGANTLTERIHQITATYVGNATFATSNNSIQQEVNNPTQVSGTMFTNPGTVTINDTGGVLAVPYPSNIFVSGLGGSISKVTVTLQNINFPETGDVDLLLVGPAGQKYVFWSDAGGGSSSSTGTFVVDDAGATQLPSSGSISAATYKPADYNVESDTFPSPAPSGPYNTAGPNGSSTFASVFGGANPNGKWSLYATDDSGSGGINSTIAGWKLTFTTTSDSATTTTLTSSPNPSLTNQPITFTATVTSTTTVNAGTVTFRRGATNLCANVAVNGSGVATCNVSAGTLLEGSHLITADYNGSPGQFNISTGTTTQVVNSPTVVTCLNFANNGGITVANSGIGTPYPSNIVVSGLTGSISKVTLTMTISNAPTPDHNDFVLVGPGGQKFQFFGDAGGTTDIINQTITLDDNAQSALPDSTAIVSGTYRPTSYTGDPDIFPSPAPTGPYNPAAPEGTATFANIFNNISPNGTWQLYAVEDAGDAVNTTISNWSLTFLLAPIATTTGVTSSANPSAFGQPVTFTATVTSNAGIPTGNVEFFDGNTSLGTSALNASGVATKTISNLSVATHTIKAQYAGTAAPCNGNYGTSNSGNLSQAITPLTISGTVSYGITPMNQAQKFVSGVLMSATGASSVSNTTNSAGSYLLENLTPNGQYTVTPTKTGNANGIIAFDATLVLRCVAAGNACTLTADQLIAADTDGDMIVTAFDATQILRYVASNGANQNTGNTGTWKFSPATRSHTMTGAFSGENYTAILVGEIDGDWTP